MPNVLFVAPVYTASAPSHLSALAAASGGGIAVISEEPMEHLPRDVHPMIRAYERVGNGLDARALASAAQRIAAKLGPIHRMIAVAEGAQVPLAEAREQLGVVGMGVEVAKNFREKSRMKAVLQEGGLPVARSRLVTSMDAALAFAAEVGYPLIVKPPAGVASRATCRANNLEELRAAVYESATFGGGAALVEEMIVGREFSYDAFMLRGRLMFHSISRYSPTPLEVMENPWMQWTVVVPREHDAAEFEDIRDMGARALSVLGLETGMSHLEWFRKKSGGVIISEVAARPPGAQIQTLIGRAHDVDSMAIWAKLMIDDVMDPLPERRYASGGAYLRGQGQGRVRAVHGYDIVQRDIGHLITDARIPAVGQEKATSYEGEGFVLVRHPETKVVDDALRHIISTVRVEIA